MKTTVIPAQITTVEDKIAGNLNLTQILLFLAPLFISTFIYAVLPYKLHFTMYKIPFITGAFIICLSLALRIKGKVLINWLIILIQYALRPRYYIFDKNDPYLKDMDLIPLNIGNRVAVKKGVSFVNKNNDLKKVTVSDLVKIEHFMNNPQNDLSFKFERNGGLNVAFQKVQK